MRILWQSFLDPAEHEPYVTLLRRQLVLARALRDQQMNRALSPLRGIPPVGRTIPALLERQSEQHGSRTLLGGGYLLRR